jgi:transposase
MVDLNAPRILVPDRTQLGLHPFDPDSLVPEDHVVRGIWAMVEKMDLSAFYDQIAARGSQAGRPATDPRLLLSLWLFAVSEGIGSARLLERLCERDAPYRWLCGGVPVNYHTLSSFRTTNGSKVDELLTKTLAGLMANDMLKLHRVAQDGMKVRASSGAASFRRKDRLERCYEDAHKQIKRLRRELEEDPATANRRDKVAQERAAKDRTHRLELALAAVQRMEKKRKEEPQYPSTVARQSEPRASTTDADSRVMKMADGGYRPAYNVQLATDSSGFIVGAQVTNEGTDGNAVTPMLEEIEKRTGQTPKEYLVDGGYATTQNIETIAERGATPYAPVKKPRKEGVNPHEPKPGDSSAVAEWRQRMATADAKGIYIQRGCLAERTNAELRTHRGLDGFTVRGLDKVRSVVLLTALSFNLLHMLAQGLTT